MNKRMREVPLGALMAAVEIMDADFDSAIPRFESWRPSQHSRRFDVEIVDSPRVRRRENNQRGKDTDVVGDAIMRKILACRSAPCVGEIDVAPRLSQRSPLGSTPKA